MSQPELMSHLGKKVKRIREIRGMKQDTLANLLGETQQWVSKIEQSEVVGDDKLERVAKALNVTVETIKEFQEDALAGTSNFFSPHFSDNSTAVYNNFNPVEKMAELYERLLAEEREKNRALQQRIDELEKGRK